ncbi:MAG TPA: hypothetical protein VGE51_06610 [Fontimonas sp.]
MSREKMELLLQQAADRAFEARRRIEKAVDAGELPAWVMATCEQWERAAFSYGATTVLQRPVPVAVPAPASGLVH